MGSGDLVAEWELIEGLVNEIGGVIDSRRVSRSEERRVGKECVP